MLHECIVQTLTDGSFVRAVKETPLPHRAEFAQLGFDLAHVAFTPLIDEGAIHSTELRHLKEPPGAFMSRRRSGLRQACVQECAQWTG